MNLTEEENLTAVVSLTDTGFSRYVLTQHLVFLFFPES